MIFRSFHVLHPWPQPCSSLTRTMIDLAGLQRPSRSRRPALESLRNDEGEVMPLTAPSSSSSGWMKKPKREAARKSALWLERSLQAVLEALPTAAFIVDEDGRVHASNAAARRSRSAKREARAAARRLADGGELAAHDVTPIEVAGHARHWLIRAQPKEPAHVALERAVRQWRLSQRQAQVMECLLRGDANKTIAARLGCAVATVEVHITALLRKAGADSRVDVVAKVWRASAARS